MASRLLKTRGLSIDRLLSFCSIVEAGSVVAAADRDPVKQSQFSRQIRDLERVLDAKLFAKEGRRLKLTVAGQRLAAMTESYFAGLEELGGDIRSDLRPLTLGTGESVIRWMLMPRLGDILSSADGSRVDFRGMRTQEIVRQLKDGEVDVGILRSDATIDDALEAAPFRRQEFVLIAARIALPGRSMPAVRSVGELPVVMLSGDGAFVQAATRLAQKNGLHLLPRVTVESFSHVIQAAKALGLGAFIPVEAKKEFPEDQFAELELPGIETLARELSVAVNRQAAGIRERPRRFALRLARMFQVQGRD